VGGAVGVAVDELGGIGEAGGDDDAAEVVDGVVEGEKRRLVAGVGGRGGDEAAVDLVGEPALCPEAAEGVDELLEL
jgi:hypothetical protein